MPKAKFADRTKPKPKSVKSKKKLSSKRELSRFGKKNKAGHAGTAVEYMGRTKVIKELQLSIGDFRKLCILKGIYPRDPKNKRHLDPKQTYYHYKDVSYLRHEPLLRKFRETKAFMKKLKRAIGRNEISEARRLYDNRPIYTLDHLVKERYPRFEDALNDMDDPLSLLHLFAALPSVNPVKSEHISTARQLSREWLYYVARSKCLRKVFFSIKGIYFQAHVKGCNITWLVPWPFAQNPPNDVDYRVMLTFLELSEVTLRFTLYKLYHTLGLTYPPTIKAALEEDGQNLAALQPSQYKDKESAGASGMAPAYSSAAVLAMPEAGVSAIPPAVRARMANMASLREVMKQIAAEQGGAETSTSSAGAGSSSSSSASKPGSSSIAKVDLAAAEAGAVVRGKGKKSNLGPQKLAPETVSTSMYDFVDAEDAEDELETGDLATFADADESARKALESARAQQAFQRLFKGCVIFLGREVPRDICEFIICAFSGRLGWDGPGSPYKADDPRITHQVVDRPMPADGSGRITGREYVQPQWIADSVNARMLLPVARYAPGAVLPPHLSPFVDDSSEGYVPAYRQELERLRAAAAVTGRLADVLTAAEAEAAAVPKDAEGRVSRVGADAADSEEEEDDGEEEEDEGEEEEEDGEEELDGDDEEDASLDDDDEEEDAEELLQQASKRSKGSDGKTAQPPPVGGKSSKPTPSSTSLAALEGERRALAASMLAGNKKKAYEAGMAKRGAEEARVAALQAKAKAAASAGDAGVGKAIAPQMAGQAAAGAGKPGKRSRDAR